MTTNTSGTLGRLAEAAAAHATSGRLLREAGQGRETPADPGRRPSELLAGSARCGQRGRAVAASNATEYGLHNVEEHVHHTAGVPLVPGLYTGQPPPQGLQRRARGDSDRAPLIGRGPPLEPGRSSARTRRAHGSAVGTFRTNRQTAVSATKTPTKGDAFVSTDLSEPGRPGRRDRPGRPGRERC